MRETVTTTDKPIQDLAAGDWLDTAMGVYRVVRIASPSLFNAHYLITLAENGQQFTVSRRPRSTCTVLS